MSAARLDPKLKFALELGPLALFFLAYWKLGGASAPGEESEPFKRDQPAIQQGAADALASLQQAKREVQRLINGALECGNGSVSVEDLRKATEG